MNINYKQTCKRIALTGSFLFVLSLVACDNANSKTIRERLIENNWENTGSTTVEGTSISKDYTGIYNFMEDGTFIQTLNDCIISGSWDVQGDSIVVFDKEDFNKKRFWDKIAISKDLLRVVPTICPKYTTNCRAYDITGTATSYIEVYIPVQ